MKASDVDWGPAWRATGEKREARLGGDSEATVMFIPCGDHWQVSAASRHGGAFRHRDASPIQVVLLAAMTPGEVYQWLIGRAGGDTT